jgi:hypothetical protein
MIDRDRKNFHIAPLLLGSMQAFSCITQLLAVSARPYDPTILMMYYMLGLSPILALFLVRSIDLLVGAMAVPIVIIFCGQTGEMILHGQAGGIAIWLNIFFSLASAALIAVWAFVTPILFAGSLSSHPQAQPPHRSTWLSGA